MSLPIKIKKNGPLFISLEDAAGLILSDHTGAPIELPTDKGIALCRCGASKRKPFCDASHREIGFDGTLATPPAQPDQPAEGLAPSAAPSATTPSDEPPASGVTTSA